MSIILLFFHFIFHSLFFLGKLFRHFFQYVHSVVLFKAFIGIKIDFLLVKAIDICKGNLFSPFMVLRIYPQSSFKNHIEVLYSCTHYSATRLRIYPQLSFKKHIGVLYSCTFYSTTRFRIYPQSSFKNHIGVLYSCTHYSATLFRIYPPNHLSKTTSEYYTVALIILRQDSENRKKWLLSKASLYS